MTSRPGRGLARSDRWAHPSREHGPLETVRDHLLTRMMSTNYKINSTRESRTGPRGYVRLDLGRAEPDQPGTPRPDWRNRFDRLSRRKTRDDRAG